MRKDQSGRITPLPVVKIDKHIQRGAGYSSAALYPVLLMTSRIWATEILRSSYFTQASFFSKLTRTAWIPAVAFSFFSSEAAQF